MEWLLLTLFVVDLIVGVYFMMDGNLITVLITVSVAVIGGLAKIIVAQMNIKKDIARMIEQNKEANNKHNDLHDEHKDIIHSISLGNKTVEGINKHILTEKERQTRIETKLDGKIQAGIEQGAAATKLLLEQLVESKQEVADVSAELKGLKEEINQLKEENQKLKQEVMRMEEENTLLGELASKDGESFTYGKEQSKDDFELEL